MKGSLHCGQYDMPEGEPPLEDAREGRRGAGVEGAAIAEGVGLEGLE